MQHFFEDQKLLFNDFARDFPFVFKLEGDPLTATNALEMQIPLDTTEIIHTPQYKLPRHYTQAAIKEIENWHRQGIVDESISPYNSPIIVVPKKGMNPDGSPKYRVFVDLRNINKYLIKSFYHLPSIQTLITEIPRTKYYSCLDLSDGYLAIKVKPEDCQILAFTCGPKRYQFTRLPFGLLSSSFTFSLLMESRRKISLAIYQPTLHKPDNRKPDTNQPRRVKKK